MQVTDLKNVFPTETMEAGTVLFENDARYFTGTVVEKSRITCIPEQVLKDRIATSDPFIIYCVRNWPNFGDRLIG